MTPRKTIAVFILCLGIVMTSDLSLSGERQVAPEYDVLILAGRG
jgi:hypothetical protein